MKHSLRVPLYFPIVELILVVYPIKFIPKTANNIRDITLKVVQTPSKARLNYCIKTGCSDLEIAWNLHGHLLMACHQTHGMK